MTPLVIGMMLCLLILGAAVIAAGSAVLAKRNLQSLCDGVVTAVAGSLTTDQLRDGSGIDAAAADYLALSGADVAVDLTSDGTSISAACAEDAPITFGAVFATPTSRFEVRSVSRISVVG